MKRTGAKGEGEFERCTWDEGIKALADKLKELKDAGTPEALGALSPQFWPVLAQMGRRFMNIYGTPNYLHSAICASQGTHRGEATGQRKPAGGASRRR